MKKERKNQLGKKLKECSQDMNKTSKFKKDEKKNNNNKIFFIKKIMKNINENNIKNNNTKLNTFIENNNFNYRKKLINKKEKVMRNNKKVYIYKSLVKEKKEKKIKIGKNKRSSIYRGVSKNGYGWQVLMMHNRNKSYIGTYYSEKAAAIIYDIASIKNIGINAKTNFLYNNEQISKILETNINLKNPNILKFISELIM